MVKFSDLWYKNSHFIVSLILALAIVCFQAQFIARLASPWLHVDLITVFVVYFSIEHYLLSSLVKIAFVSVLVQMLSGAPSGFYFTYYLLALVFASFLSRKLVLYNRLSQFLAFSGIFILKFVLIYFIFQSRENLGFFSDYFIEVYPTALATILAAVPLFYMFSKIDERFSLVPLSHRRTEIEL